ncbi:cell division protein FtsW (lipid II flippase) [Bacillus niacini]|uniref:Cell division protein FtsW (Lipid II flippase) n=1 Tax=Neobacillus niacini TaxID=86668 RepID=A0A852TK73_9BACI|nr:FtsW/RodA/SpoVE family cell cycle protein [Neobacillus niacini]NYE08699.1 cell division protein FtsW (lipid II flippase) [Neobacillus niacini]
MTNNRKQIFLNEVTNQIRSKEVKNYVANELNYHLKEAKRIWLERGLSESEAEEKAVEQMGNPTKLGMQMNKLHRPKVDWWLILLLAISTGLSFLPMFSLGYMKDTYFIIYKILIAFLGGAATVGVMLVDYRKWKRHGWLFYTIGMLLLFILAFFSNTMINGLRLIKLGPITIESLMALPFFYLAWASFFNNEKLRVWHSLLLFLSPILLFLALPSISTIYLYSVMVFVMLWWSQFSKKVKWMISVGTLGTIMLTALLVWPFIKPYQIVRLLAFFNPEKYADTEGYIILRIQELMSKAGWFGVTGTKEFIPEARTNFVFVSFTYYYGWIFGVLLAVILLLFAARMMVIQPKIKESYGQLLLIGGVALYGIQLVSNIGMALGLFPMTSMSLPFISYGLMPTLLNAILIGSVLSVYRRKDLLWNS